MDIATVVGIVGGLIVLMGAILAGGDVLIFVNIPSILIVFVGSIFVVAIKFNLEQLKTAVAVGLKTFLFKLDDPEKIIDEVVSLAKIARKDGPLALEQAVINNDFMARGVQLVVDSADIEVIKSILGRERSSTYARHEDGQKIYLAINEAAPAMGMIGTLVGLVQMLSNMSDPKSIGPAMAVALLTTLYGAVIANMLAKPMADKLGARMAEEDALQALIIDAVLGIGQGLSPTVIEETLVSYLPTKARKALAEKREQEAA